MSGIINGVSNIMTNDITQEEINKAIDNCHFRHIYDGIAICRGEVAPCHHIIDRGKCDTLKKIFAEQASRENKEKDGV